MKTFHTPVVNLRYWVLIFLVSIFGTNTGDLAVRYYKFALDYFGLPVFFGLRHIGPFPILAILFAIIYLLEKRDERGIEFYFWSAIVLIRTAATNIADTLNDDLNVSVLLSSAILFVVYSFGAIYWQSKRLKPIQEPVTLNSNSLYWLMMSFAGVIGTLLGDYLAHEYGLAMMTLILSIVMILIIAFGYKKYLPLTALFWIGILFARISGTAAGDWLAKSIAKGGAGLGLENATMCSGLVFVLLTFWQLKKKATTE